MSVWLDSSSNSNKFKQSYFRDFVDVSGEVLIRNGLSLKLYNNNVPTRVQFSINSNEFRVFNDADQTYYDISNTKLVYLQDLSENVQERLNLFTEKTKYIATDAVTPDTLIELNPLQKSVTVRGGLDVCGNFYAQYADNSIPVSAISGMVGGISDETQAALNLKANLSDVDASFTLVTSAIADKANRIDVDASFTLVTSAIAEKANLIDVDASFTLVTSAIAEKANTISVDASFAVVNSAIAEKAATSDVDVSFAVVNSALAEKATTNHVDASFNLKADINSPVFTGSLVVSSGDVSMNDNLSIGGNVTIKGNLSVFQHETTSIINTTINNYEIVITKDISLNGNLIVSNDASLNGRLSVADEAIFNSKLTVLDDASFNGRVDICGNFYAQYPNESIPMSAVDGISDTLYQLNASLIVKPTFEEVDASLALVNSAIAEKASVSVVDASFVSVNNAIAEKASSGVVDASFVSVNSAIAEKASSSVVDASFALVNSAIAEKASSSVVDVSFALVNSAIAEKASSSVVDASFASVNSAIAEKASSSVVDASFVSVNSAIAEKASSSVVDASFVSVNTAIAEKASSSDVDASFVSVNNAITEKASSSDVDASFVSVNNAIAEKASVSVVDASFVSVNSAIAEKASVSVVDASFVSVNNAIAEKASSSVVDASFVLVNSAIAEKAISSVVDASFASINGIIEIKAPIANPTFTGVPTAPTATAGTNTTQLATTAFVQTAVDGLVASAPGALDTLNELAAALGNDAAFSTTITNTLALKAPLANPTFTGIVNTSKVSVSSDASFNGRVDVCGNFYAQYPEASIPASAVIGTVGGISNETQAALNLKANTSEVDASFALITGALAEKAAKSDIDASFVLVNSAISEKAAKSDIDASFVLVNSAISEKAAISDIDASFALVTSAISEKAAISDIDASFALVNSTIAEKANTISVDASFSLVNSALVEKAATSDVDASFNLKADINSPVFTGSLVVSSGDVSMNENLSIGGNLTVKGNLSVFQHENTSIINTTINNYEIVITKDISLNGSLIVANDASLNGRLFVADEAHFNSKLTVQDDASFNGQVDICGNFYAQYPNESIPMSAVDGISDILYQLNASVNLKPTFEEVDASFALVNSAIAEKASISVVDASFVSVNSAIAEKSSSSVVDASFAFVNSAIAEKSNSNVVDASFALVNSAIAEKASTGVVDASFVSVNSAIAEKASSSVVDASFVSVNSAIAEKATTINVDASFVLVNSAIAEKAAIIDVDASFASINSIIELKAPIANPTFTGIVNASNVSVSGDASFNGRVDICGNFYAQYADASIPASAIIGMVGGISDETQTALNLKANISDVDASFALITTAIAEKAATSDVDASFALITTAIAEKANTNLPVFTGDVSMNDNLSIGGNLTVKGNLSVFQHENTSIINTTINNYEIVITKDISLNGNLIVANDASFNGHLFVADEAHFNSKLTVQDDASFNGRVDICGNFYAQYPDSSIPASAIIGGVGGSSVVDLTNDQTISGVKTFSDGIIIGTTSFTSVAGNSNSNFQFIQLGQDIDGETASDQSGRSVSLSADGSIVAIGAPFNDGTSGNDRGSVRVYQYANNTWTKLGQDLDGEAAGDFFGWSVSLSADGSTVAIGAIYNDGNGTDSGHLRIYKYNGSAWIQLGIDIDGEAAGDNTGFWVSISADGLTVATGARYNDGNGSNSGHVRVYQYNGSVWTKLGQDIDGEATNDYSGYSVSLSADGVTVAIGAYGNDGNGTDSGHVRVYKYIGTTWTKLGQDLDGERAGDNTGYAVSISSDGTIVAIGTYLNDGTNTGNINDDRGSVRVYKYIGTTWTQLGLDIDGEAIYDNSGYSVSLSADGLTVAIGARYNDGTNTGVSSDNRGHVRIYQYDGTTWAKLGIDLDGEAATDFSGWSVSLSADSNVVAIGAFQNDGTSGGDRGHVRVYQIGDTSISKLLVSNNVDICGNFYAQYPNASIPANAINGLSSAMQSAINLKATASIVDASFTSTTSAIALKANLASPALTGVPTAPTATAGTNTTQLATTAFITTAISSKADVASPALTGVPTAPTATTGTNTTQLATTAFIATAISSKANIASPALTGVPTAPTATTGTNTTQLATTAFVKTAVDGLVASAPAALDTLKELATALGNDAAFSTTVTNTLALKAPLANPTFTGTVNASKISVSGDASFNGRVDICGNFYAKYPDSSIPASAIIGGVGGSSTDVQAALNLKANISDVDVSFSLVDSSFALVNNAIALKAPLEDPTFTGTVNASNVIVSGDVSFNSTLHVSGNTTFNSKLTVSNDVSFNSTLHVSGNTTFNSKLTVSNDASFNGRVDICGNFYAKYPASSIPQSAIIGGVGVDANSDVSLNQNLSIGGDASFNGRVDICGNFYAKYPDNSIPASAIIGGVGSGGGGTTSGGGTTVSDVVAFDNYFAIITGAGQEVTLNEDNFALIKPMPYGSIGSHDITFEDNFVMIQDGIEPYTFKRLNVTTNLSVSSLATFSGITSFNNEVYANTPSLYDSSRLVATTAYVKGQNYATASTLFRQF